MIHIALHFFVPAIVVTSFFRKGGKNAWGKKAWVKKAWAKAYLIMMATMLVDLDHLLANPIYDPGRCSIGFHPLHEPLLFLLYAALCLFPKTRYVGIGLLIHMSLDSIDCQLTNGLWFV